MADFDFVELVLTCSSWQEGQKIADTLLEKKLVACVEFIEIKSKYWWQRKLDEANEVKLIMQTRSKHFDIIEKEVNKLLSYEVPALHATSISHISKSAKKWLEEQVGNV